MIDYYEFLQISPHADTETIHRVYRFLAARFHPDNPNSGDGEMFRLLKTAYDTLANPAARADYDAAFRRDAAHEPPLSSTIDFMDSLDGELNRRLAVLAVLYQRRRVHPHDPFVPLSEIEERMGFPRDYLDFTTWYLQKKGYITRADNSDFTLTADGVDFVEAQRGNIPVLTRLLTAGTAPVSVSDAQTRPAPEEAAPASRKPARPHPEKRALKEHALDSGPIILPASMDAPGDRRCGPADRRAPRLDRRAGLPDGREEKVERRTAPADRRTEKKDRRSKVRGRRAGD